MENHPTQLEKSPKYHLKIPHSRKVVQYKTFTMLLQYYQDIVDTIDIVGNADIVGNVDIIGNVDIVGNVAMSTLLAIWQC